MDGLSRRGGRLRGNPSGWNLPTAAEAFCRWEDGGGLPGSGSILPEKPFFHGRWRKSAMEESCVRNSVCLFSFARLAVHLRILSHTAPQKSTIVSQRNFPYSPNGFSLLPKFLFLFSPPLCLPYIPAPPNLSPIASGAQPGFSHAAFPPIPAFRAMRAKPCVVRFDSVRFSSLLFGSFRFGWESRKILLESTGFSNISQTFSSAVFTPSKTGFAPSPPLRPGASRGAFRCAHRSA